MAARTPWSLEGSSATSVTWRQVRRVSGSRRWAASPSLATGPEDLGVATDGSPEAISSPAWTKVHAASGSAAGWHRTVGL
jgi:hypothetical protein